MIKKLTTGEYLKPYGDMTAQEREAYRKRVGEWLRTAGKRLLALTDRPMAKAQNMMMMSARWEKKDCEAAHEGAVLLTALMAVTETWLPSQLWVKSAWRAIRHINSVLSEVKSEKSKVKNEADDGKILQTKVQRAQTKAQTKSTDKQGGKPSQTQIEVQTKANAMQTTPSGTLGPKGRLPKQEPTGALEAQGKTQGNPATESQGTLPAEVSTPSLQGRAGEGSPVPVRPKHIDQYAYLLPKGTQERAGAVRGLLREFDETRENMYLLMEDANAKPDARAAWARKATRIDGTLKGIYKELDSEWEKLVKSGRVTVDALGNVYFVEGGQSDRNTQSNQSSQSNPTELTSEQKARRRELRKWLIDLRRGKEGEAREKRIEQWKMNWKEYLTLEPLEAALKDEKVVAAAAHFEIDINPDKQDDKLKTD